MEIDYLTDQGLLYTDLAKTHLQSVLIVNQFLNYQVLPLGPVRRLLQVL